MKTNTIAAVALIVSLAAGIAHAATYRIHVVAQCRWHGSGKVTRVNRLDDFDAPDMAQAMRRAREYHERSCRRADGTFTLFSMTVRD